MDGRPWRFYDQVFLPLDGVLPRVIEADLRSVRLTFMVRQILDRPLILDNEFEAGQVFYVLVCFFVVIAGEAQLLGQL